MKARPVRQRSTARIWRAAACLGLLALCAGAAGAWRATSQDQAALERQRRLLRDLLGRERWRQLEETRFAIHLHDLDFTPELGDNPAQHRKIGHILLRSLLKASQESVERSLRLEERRDALFRRSDRSAIDVGSRRKVDVSPRFRLDSRPWLGAKLRLRGVRSHFLSFADIRLGSELDGRNPSIKLAFQDDVRHGFIVYHAGHRQRGQALELRFGFFF